MKILQRNISEIDLQESVRRSQVSKGEITSLSDGTTEAKGLRLRSQLFSPSQCLRMVGQVETILHN